MKKNQKIKTQIETGFLANINHEFSYYFYKLIILTEWLANSNMNKFLFKHP